MRIWSEFEHPNVLKLEGYIMEHAFPALVSKWMERGSLWQYMKKHIVTRKEAISLVCTEIILDEQCLTISNLRCRISLKV